MAETILSASTTTNITSGTHTIQSGSTFSVPAGRAFYVSGTGTLLNTETNATGILIEGYSGSTASSGGAVRVETASVDFNGSTFQNSFGNEGGAVWATTFGTATFSTCSFIGNTAWTVGGGLGLNSGKAYLNSVTFSGNTAGAKGDNPSTQSNSGGGLAWGFTGKVSGTATSVYFNNNYARQNGGAVYVSSNGSGNESSLTINTGTVTNNHAGQYAGGIGVDTGCTLEMTAVDFIGNSADKAGGAMGNIGTMTLESSTVSGNSAGNGTHKGEEGGGAMFNGGTFNATSVVFSNNTTTEGGGAIYNGTVPFRGHNYNGTAIITACTFTGNSAAVGGAIYNTNVMTIDGCTFSKTSDTIANDKTLTFKGENVLNSALTKGQATTGVSKSGADNVVLKGTGTVSQTYVAQGNTTTFDSLNLDAEILGGKQNAGVTGKTIELVFNNVSMTTNTKIYGAGTAKNSNISVDAVALDFSGSLDSYKGQILAGGKADKVTINAGTVNLNVDVTGKVGVIYAGAELVSGGSFEADVMNTTIGGGTFYSYVGNGCRSSNTVDDTMEATVSSTASLTISGGTFKNIVYAGAFTSGNSVKVGGTNLTITGGTFEQMVFGGNGAKSIAASTQAASTVDGNVSVLVDASTNSISFAKSLVGGSVGEGKITGDVTVTFKGNGSNLSFGDTAYVGGDSQKSEKYANTEKKFVGGNRELVFQGFTGEFGANIRNTFDEVSFTGSSVTFTGKEDVDLRYIKTWNFDVSDGWTDLTWENGSNDFKGDTINLTGEAGIFMVGSADITKNWNSATYKVGGVAVDISRITCTDMGNGTFSLSLASA